jgi:(2Fe-2S) ferredoxin
MRRDGVFDKTPESGTKFHAAHVYPQNRYVPWIPATPEGYELFVRTFLESSIEKSPIFEEKKAMKQEDGFDEKESPVPEQTKNMDIEYHYIPYPSIFICSHHSRDTRCGQLGPLLLEEFQKRLARERFLKKTRGGQWNFTPSGGGLSKKARNPYAVLAKISHIGGHKYAGNVVIYFPEKWKSTGEQEVSPLAGKGIWYGRVEPKHVWGIMEETIKGGRIIEELLRGIHSPQDRVAVLD